ncbi:hypothetical protein GCM10009554_68730 [Kribbella koreensis]|uniref:Immunity protein Imm1 n=1 Tax=Kribbella koreensis TaxID=57909 RepID=A0ABP4BZY4_9ACTN
MAEPRHALELGGDGMEDVETPAWEDVAEAMKALDGYDRTILTLVRGLAHMAVGGDAGRGLVLYADLGDEDFYNLIVPDAGAGSVEVVAGGQPGVFEARQVVSEGQALAALKAFWENGRLDQGQVWERQY